MEDNLIYFNQYKEVPANAQKPIKGGRLKGYTDINPVWRIKALTEMFGPVGIGWYYKIIDKKIETANGESSAFVDIEFYYKHEGEWSMPIIGTGGSSFVEKEKNGLYMSDECYKMALTDAMSVVCKALGIASDVYWNQNGSKYQKEEKEVDISKMSLEEIGQQKVMFGKHSGETLKEIIKNDKGYCDWLQKAEKTDKWLVDSITKLYKAIEEKNNNG